MDVAPIDDDDDDDDVVVVVVVVVIVVVVVVIFVVIIFFFFFVFIIVVAADVVVEVVVVLSCSCKAKMQLGPRRRSFMLAICRRIPRESFNTGLHLSLAAICTRTSR